MIHTVVSGEYLSLIAERYGLTWQKLWEAPENAGLREKRKSPNILYPGDEVFIPGVEPKHYDRPSEARHRFRTLGNPQRLRLVIRDDFGNALANLEYELAIPAYATRTGRTTDQGLVSENLPVDATRAELYFAQLRMRRTLQIGYLDPISTNRGVQQRLRNLGFDPGPIDGIVGPLTRSAIARFQEWCGIPVTSLPDQVTRDRLELEHEGINRSLPQEEDPGDAATAYDDGEEDSVDDSDKLGQDPPDMTSYGE